MELNIYQIDAFANKFNKNKLFARQLSKRGGELVCELRGDRIFIYGKAVKYLEGRINVEI